MLPGTMSLGEDDNTAQAEKATLRQLAPTMSATEKGADGFLLIQGMPSDAGPSVRRMG